MGDGTTTVVILAGEFLKECKPFVEEGVHPQVIIRAFRQAGQLAVARVKALAVSIAGKDEEETKDLLRKCASTAMNSKLVPPALLLSSTPSQSTAPHAVLDCFLKS